MNEKSFRTLEFNKIKDILREKCISAAGKEKAAELVPSVLSDEINRRLDETAASAYMIAKKGGLPLGGIRDIRAAVKRALVAGSLNIDEILSVADFLYVCGKVVTYGKTDEAGVLSDMFGRVMPLADLESEITRCIAPPDTVKDSASAELSSARKNIQIANARIREQLNGIIHSAQYKTMLQDSIVTIRSDRFCVPVKQEHARNFPGLVHDQSATGQTVFIEPSGVVDLNNRIKELKAKEKAEIERILMSLTAYIAENAEVLTANAEVIAELDFIFAKGELALTQDAHRPRFNDKGYINIIKGRHPLLGKTTVVPTDIWLGGDFNMLLITGPNTGGKTVALKTIGLFTLMGQAGLFIGAKEGSELAVFDNVFADIGDEQSIEQSLSTFSSHMSNIIKILGEATPRSLVLFDELGAGTDPTEGAALAISILEHLHAQGIRAAVTTHYSELKVYALSTKGVENACCEFDVSTLRPTYRLLIGIPGKSNAFEISRRLGLSEDIIQNAKAVLSKEDKRFEDIITDLEISKKTAVIEKERAEALRREAEELKIKFEADKAKILAEREKIIQRAREDARRVFADAREEADTLLAEYKRTLKEGKQHEINEARANITRQMVGTKNDGEEIIITGDSYAKTGRMPKEGDRVIISGMDKQAVITKPPDASGNAEAAVGNIKMKVHISQLSEDKTKLKQKPQASYAPRANKAAQISPEIDLRGQTAMDAIEQCEKYIDDAYLANISQIRIIHGKGTFALRNAINAYLKTHPRVKSARPGGAGEGDSGVTIAELKA